MLIRIFFFIRRSYLNQDIFRIAGVFGVAGVALERVSAGKEQTKEEQGGHHGCAGGHLDDVQQPQGQHRQRGLRGGDQGDGWRENQPGPSF